MFRCTNRPLNFVLLIVGVLSRQKVDNHELIISGLPTADFLHYNPHSRLLEVSASLLAKFLLPYFKL